MNDKWGWFEDGNKDKDVKYIGEFKDGTFEDRQPNGQVKITYPNGRKYVGEWKDGETKRPWYCHFKGWEVCLGMEGE